MTTLTQQLEDKKKMEIQNKCELELRNKSNTDGELFYGDAFEIFKKYLDKTEIAILEQAIAEMQKQRQEILEKIEKICNDNQMYADMDEDEFWGTSKISPQDAQKRADYNYELFEHLIKQLNQPKEEGKG